jgi:hypothetical protein
MILVVTGFSEVDRAIGPRYTAGFTRVVADGGNGRGNDGQSGLAMKALAGPD